MNVKTNKSGFTLTEILIVLVIAGILLALILPNSVRAITRGQGVSDDAQLQSCRSAITMCLSENRGNQANCNTIALLTAGANPYLPAAPTYSNGTPIVVAAVNGDLVCR